MSFEDDMRADPVALAKEYSIFASNPSYTEWTFKDTQVGKSALDGQYAGFNRLNMKRDYLIAKVRLEIGTSDRGTGCLLVKPSVLADAPGLPVYFLPWDNRGAAVRMCIPDRDPNRPEDEHPKVFITAVLSGCSIIFKGTAQNPTIYHCGTEGGVVGTPTQGESNTFFRNMLTGPGYRAVGGIIKSTDYMVPDAGSATVEDMQDRALEALKRRRPEGIVLKRVSAWGSCFGVRNGHDWKFYVQRNGSVSYNRVELVTAEKDFKKKGLLGSKTATRSFVTTKITTNLASCKPIEVQKVFPGQEP